MTMQATYRDAIAAALRAIEIPAAIIKTTEIPVEQPANPTHGDWSSSIALSLHGQLRAYTAETADETLTKRFQHPRALAEALLTELQQTIATDAAVESLDIAGPGFINLTLSTPYLLQELQSLLTRESLDIAVKDPEQVVIEFTDPNPFKQLHIGHLYSNTIGESIARLNEASGHAVRRADYYGDVGMHVAKSIWGIDAQLQEQVAAGTAASVETAFEVLQEAPLEERVAILGTAYSTGATAFKEDEAAHDEITALNTYLFKIAQDVLREHEPNAVINADYDSFVTAAATERWDYSYLKQLYTHGRAWSLESFKEVFARLGMSFDNFYPESKSGEYGIQTVRQGLEQGIFEESDGAVVYPGETFGLHTRVFINSHGLPTYECKELGLPTLKAADGEYDRSLIITGNEIDEYFKVLLHAMHRVLPELGAKTSHLSHGMVKLPSGKMSSRTGNVITAEALLDEAVRRVEETMAAREAAQEDTTKAWDPEQRAATAERIGQAAIKYAFLKPAIGGDIVFEFDQALAYQGNSGPYLQYTHVRTQSILEKAQEEGVSRDTNKPFDSLVDTLNAKEASLEPATREVLTNLLTYSEEVQQAAATAAPHRICNHLYALAQSFNTFYGKHSVLDAEDELVQAQRLAIVAATGRVLEHGLELLGIKTVERM